MAVRGRRPGHDSALADRIEWGEAPEDERQRELEAKAWGGVDSIDDRLRIARRRFYLTAGTSAATASVLMATAFFPPFLVLAIPPGIMAFDLQRKLRALAARGYGFWDVVSSSDSPRDSRGGSEGDSSRQGAGSRGRGAPPPRREIAQRSRDPRARWKEVSAEAARGRQGVTVRGAVEDALAILEIVERLAPQDRAMLADLVPTVDALIERCASLGVTLDRIDSSVSPGELPAIDERIARLTADGAAVDGARRLELLQHQRATVQDLLQRRTFLASKMESVTLLLRSLRFDLLKLRSAGLHSALDAMTGATQQARALSRDIGTLLEAGDEVRGLRG